METVIKTIGLSRKFKDKFAVKNVNIEIKKGEIYGFVGMNGAGKSTCIRMITGLLNPTEGKVEIFGSTNNGELIEARKRIAGYVDIPSFYGNMSAYQNMEINRRLLGNKDENRIPEILKLVGLEDVGKKTVKKFSLGMKQRLAIGQALLNEPEILILDEPVNGLDPAGIIEIRELIRELSEKQGITFLITSHILSELQKIATSYGFIKNGNLVEQISVEELKSKLDKYILVKGTQEQEIMDYLKAKLNLEDIKIVGDGIAIYGADERFKEIAKVLCDSELEFNGINIESQTLERYFVDRIGGANNE